MTKLTTRWERNNFLKERERERERNNTPLNRYKKSIYIKYRLLHIQQNKEIQSEIAVLFLILFLFFYQLQCMTNKDLIIQFWSGPFFILIRSSLYYNLQTPKTEKRKLNLEPCWIHQRNANRLDLQVMFQTIHSFLSAMSTHLVPTKRKCSIIYIIAVHPYCPNS